MSTPPSSPTPSNADVLLQAAKSVGITDPKELANFMGQMQIESQGFTRMQEGLGYSPERLLEVFPGRNGMKTLEDAKALVAGGQEKIAEAIYGGKWGEDNLGNKPGSGDAFTFRGRGFVHLTGRDNYAHYGKALGLDLVNHPELAADPKNASAIAVQYWKERVVAHGHQTDVNGATNDITGNKKGQHESFPRRNAAANAWSGKLGPITDKHHPGHGLYEQALHKLEKYSVDHPGFMNAQQIKSAAAAVAVEVHMHGLKKIDVLEPNDSGNKLIAAQGRLGTAQSKVVDLSKEQAANTPLEQSSKAYHEKPQNHQHPHQQTQADQTQGQGVPALAR